MLPIVLVAATMGSSLLTHGTFAQCQRTARVSIATMQMRETMRFAMTGCLAGGIGVGLDPANVVDFLRPGAPAAQYLRIGDVVVNIDEVSLLDPVTGQQRKLKDAVNTSLDEHTVVITRPLTPLSKEAAQALGAEALRRSSSGAAAFASAPVPAANGSSPFYPPPKPSGEGKPSWTDPPR